MKLCNAPSLLDVNCLRVEWGHVHNCRRKRYPLTTRHKVRIMRSRVSGRHIGQDAPGVKGRSGHDLFFLNDPRQTQTQSVATVTVKPGARLWLP